MNLKRNYIKKAFIDVVGLKMHGIFFSGINGEGEFKMWYPTDNIEVHCFYKNKEIDGVYKRWTNGGDLKKHQLYDNGKMIQDYLK